MGVGGAAGQLLARLDWPAESRLCLCVAAIKRGAPSGRWRLPIVSTPVRTEEAKDRWHDDETPSVSLNSEDTDGHALEILDQQIAVFPAAAVLPCLCLGSRLASRSRGGIDLLFSEMPLRGADLHGVL